MMVSGEDLQHNMGFRSQWEISVPFIHIVLVVSKMTEGKVSRKISNTPNLSAAAVQYRKHRSAQIL
jgi:hypothetical protein